MTIIRHTQPEDAAQLAQCIDQVAQEGKFLLRTTGFSQSETESFIRHLQDGGGSQWVAALHDDECREQIIGWCDLRHHSPTQGQLGMGVLAPYRGQGIGKRLLWQSLEQGFDQGLQTVDLEVFTTNDAAIGLYRNTGFVQTGYRAGAYQLNGNSKDVLVFCLSKKDWVENHAPTHEA